MLMVGSIFAMLCVSINLRAFAAMSEEVEQNSRLSGQIQSLMDENLALQEEIHMLRTNPTIIEREARKIGIYLKQE
jgi:cell division protein FtsB